MLKIAMLWSKEKVMNILNAILSIFRSTLFTFYAFTTDYPSAVAAIFAVMGIITISVIEDLDEEKRKRVDRLFFKGMLLLTFCFLLITVYGYPEWIMNERIVPTMSNRINEEITKGRDFIGLEEDDSVGGYVKNMIGLKGGQSIGDYVNNFTNDKYFAAKEDINKNIDDVVDRTFNKLQSKTLETYPTAKKEMHNNIDDIVDRTLSKLQSRATSAWPFPKIL
jgi:hypothetical protein